MRGREEEGRKDAAAAGGRRRLKKKKQETHHERDGDRHEHEAGAVLHEVREGAPDVLDRDVGARVVCVCV